jgi:hypothetical protein
VRGVLIYCADYRCSHSVALSADRITAIGHRAAVCLLSVWQARGRGSAGFQLINRPGHGLRNSR